MNSARLRLLTLLAVFGVSVSLAGAQPKHSKSAPGEDIFRDATVLRIRIEISQDGVSQLRGTTRPYRASMGIDRDPRPEVPCTVYEGNRVYTNVAVHIKGTGGSFRSIDRDPALSFNFGKLAPDQTFHGFKKISLNNSVQDPTYMSEKICREMFDQIGIPVPRAGFATLELNGRDLGMRVMLEGTDKRFLRRYFKDVSGNLYDSGLIRDFDAQLSVICGDHSDDHSDLKHLLSAMNKPAAERMTALGKILDVDRFIRLVAMEVLLSHWDGYVLHRNNYRIYHDMDHDRLIFLPHGMDQMFGVYKTTPELSLFPEMEGMLAQAVVETTEGQRRYVEALGKLYRGAFNAEKLTRRVRDLAAVVHPVIAEKSEERASFFDERVAMLTQRILRRSASIQRQLDEMGR